MIKSAFSRFINPNLLFPLTQILAARIVYLILSMLTGIIIGRTLGPDGKGLISLVLLTSTMLFNFAHLGLANSIVYHYGRRLLDVRSLYRGVIIAGTISGGIVAGVFLLLIHVGLSSVFGDVPKIWLVYAACLTPINLWLHYLSYSFLAQGDTKSFSLVAIFPMVVYCGLLIILSLVGHITVSTALISWALGCIATLGFALLRARSFFRQLSSTLWPGWAHLLRYGLRSYANTVVALLSSRLDAFLINYWLTPAELGLYTVAVGLSELLWLCPEAASSLLLSESAKGHRDQSINRTIIILLILLFFVAVSIWVGGREIILLLYGPQFVPAQAALRLLLPGTLALSFTKLYTGVSIGRGYPELPLFANIVALVLTGMGDLLLIPRWGIQGAALASTIAHIASVIPFVLLGRHLYKVV